MRFALVALALMAAAPFANACEFNVNSGTYMNKDGRIVMINQTSCTEISVHAKATGSHPNPETWTLKIDGTPNALPAATIANLEVGERAVAKQFRFTIRPRANSGGTQLDVEVKNQKIAVMNPANKKPMAVLTVSLNGELDLWNGAIHLRTNELRLVDFPAFGSAMAPNEKAADLPVWKRGFLAGANYMMGSVIGNLSEDLHLM